MVKINARVRAAVAAILAGGMVAAMAGCGGSSATSGATGTSIPDTITTEVAYASRDFMPNTTSGALPMSANWHVVEPLYALDYTTYKTFPALAKGAPQKVSDTEYVITLRDGAKFSDGTPVRASDVVSSYKRSTAEGSLFISMLDFIDSVEAKDGNQVDFKLKEAFPMFEKRLALIPIVPSGKSDAELKKMPTGSGPWKYTAITDRQVSFEKNDAYNGKYPAQTKKMVWNVNVDDTARVTAMQAGKTDVMENVPAKAVQTLTSSGSDIQTVQGFNQAFIMFNTKKKPFDDPRVRQAVFYSIDTKKLIDNQLSGQAQTVTSFLPENFANYHKAKNVYTKNTAKAKELLKEAGVNGPIKTTLYTTDQTWVTQLAPQIKNDLAESGIDVDIQSMKSSALYPSITDKDGADFSMVLAPGDPSVFGNDPDLLMNWWYGDNIWTKQRTFWKGSEGYDELHDLMDKALSASSDAERQDYWNQCFDLLSEQVPLYPLFHRKVSTAVKKGVFNEYKTMGTTGLNLLQAKVAQ